MKAESVKICNSGLFYFIFVFSIQLTINILYNLLPMTRFKRRTSGVEHNRFTNWATTSALRYVISFLKVKYEFCRLRIRKSFFKWAIPGLFSFSFVFSIQLTVGKQLNVWYKSLPMTGFEPRTYGVRSDCSTNWATTIIRKSFNLNFVPFCRPH